MDSDERGTSFRITKIVLHLVETLELSLKLSAAVSDVDQPLLGMLC